ncbi:hypothetical protein Y032_0068g198 [Ancylostoma ceylanicum]|uniref:Uncharacterized protein n=1 Tax=Ancylostoma ceylanicum TaxID=53326 RepID=A0A016TYL1_9BILA|nr:hypothetical protein Y032_0068g198 [Ancylostoma ceylanicum]
MSASRMPSTNSAPAPNGLHFPVRLVTRSPATDYATHSNEHLVQLTFLWKKYQSAFKIYRYVEQYRGSG